MIRSSLIGLMSQVQASAYDIGLGVKFDDVNDYVQVKGLAGFYPDEMGFVLWLKLDTWPTVSGDFHSVFANGASGSRLDFWFRDNGAATTLELTFNLYASDSSLMRVGTYNITRSDYSVGDVMCIVAYAGKTDTIRSLVAINGVVGPRLAYTNTGKWGIFLPTARIGNRNGGASGAYSLGQTIGEFTMTAGIELTEAHAVSIYNGGAGANVADVIGADKILRQWLFNDLAGSGTACIDEKRVGSGALRNFAGNGDSSERITF